jgi:hypothetical protein
MGQFLERLLEFDALAKDRGKSHRQGVPKTGAER